MELFYLHKNRFAPNIKVLDELGLNKEKDFVFLRFVSWGAFHDIGEKGVSKEDKIKIVKKIGTKLYKRNSIRVQAANPNKRPLTKA